MVPIEQEREDRIVEFIIEDSTNVKTLKSIFEGTSSHDKEKEL